MERQMIPGGNKMCDLGSLALLKSIEKVYDCMSIYVEL